MDAEKCFNKLWLKDTLIDLHEAGSREREVKMIYLMNKKAEITINTPVGETEEITAKEIVKQGTIFGPKLCCVSTDKINKVGTNTPITYIAPNLYVECLIYVDDIGAAGNNETIKTVGENLVKMEENKKFLFSTKKSNVMIIKAGKEKTEEIDIEIKRGKLQETDKYKYLGNWLNNKGNFQTQLDAIKTKAPGMIEELKRIASASKIGECDLKGQLLIYESTVIPSLLYNLEAWIKLNKQDLEELEKIQARSLKRILGLPVSTPYIMGY